MIDGRFFIHAVVSVTIAVFALGVAACGSGEDGDSAAQEQGSASKDGEDFVATGNDKEQIKQVLHQIQEDFENVDAAGFCSKTTAAERREVAAFGRNYKHGTTCVAVIDNQAKAASKAGVEQRSTKLLSAKVNGDRATATVSNGGRPSEPLPFVKVDGEWKLAEVGFEPDPLATLQKQQQKDER